MNKHNFTFKFTIYDASPGCDRHATGFSSITALKRWKKR